MRLVGADVERLPEGGAAVVAPGDALPPGANTVLPTSFATIADGRLELIHWGAPQSASQAAARDAAALETAEV